MNKNPDFVYTVAVFLRETIWLIPLAHIQDLLGQNLSGFVC